MSELRKVVVATEHRGVFFGTFIAREEREVTLANARMCVYWSANTRGFIGLGSTGPLAGSRVTPACPRIELTGVTAIIDVTPEAVAAWEGGPWS